MTLHIYIQFLTKYKIAKLNSIYLARLGSLKNPSNSRVVIYSNYRLILLT